MKILEKFNFYEVIPETPEDCNFIKYIESASEIIVGGKSETIDGEKYRITKIRIMNSVF